MGTLDPAGEFLRTSERYRQMSDSELLILIPQSSQLTPLAQQALASEVRQRGLKQEDEEAAAPPTEKRPGLYGRRSPAFADSPAHDSSLTDSSLADSGDGSSRENAESDRDAEPSYDEERKLVELCTVWSPADALQLQSLLDRAGIPFFMGSEKATCADAVTSNFAAGVSVQVMRIGLPWAAQAMQNYEPANEPPRKQEEEPTELSVRCPKCRSTEIILEDVIPEPAGAAENSSPKYRWTCDSCGNEWEDNGTVGDE